MTEQLLSDVEPPASATVAVYRVRGDGPPPWSAVCKVLSGSRRGHARWQASTDPDHWYWWRRELEVYRSGLAARLPAGLRAPRFVVEFPRPDASVAVWMEDVQVPRATEWPVDRFGLAARHLGRAQAEWAAAAPDHPWLDHTFLPGYMDRHAVDFEAELPDTPLMRAARALFVDRHRLLAALEEFPSTVCHNDFHALNLFGAAEGGETIAVDWAFVGKGPLPLDAGAFAADVVLDYGAPVARLGEIHGQVEDEFVAGLRDGGWRGDEDRLRLAMRVAAALKFAWIAPVVSTPLDDRRRARWHERYGVAGEQVLADWTAVAEWLAEIGAAAAGRLA